MTVNFSIYQFQYLPISPHISVSNARICARLHLTSAQFDLELETNTEHRIRCSVNIAHIVRAVNFPQLKFSVTSLKVLYVLK